MDCDSRLDTRNTRTSFLANSRAGHVQIELLCFAGMSSVLTLKRNLRSLGRAWMNACAADGGQRSTEPVARWCVPALICASHELARSPKPQKEDSYHKGHLRSRGHGPKRRAPELIESPGAKALRGMPFWRQSSKSQII